MAIGKVSVSSVDNGQGDFTKPERQLLFIGHATHNKGTLNFIDQTTDLDAVFGMKSDLKVTVSQAALNAGPNWTCIAYILADGETILDAYEYVASQDITYEGVVAMWPIVNQEYVAGLKEIAIMAENKFARDIFVMGRSSSISSRETWEQFISEFGELHKGIESDSVMFIPEIWKGWMGTVAGRLCHEAQSIADTPMRVQSGSIVGYSSLPIDGNGNFFNMSHAKALNDARGTVPQIYTDYDGIYCSDGMTLAAEGSDFSVIEHLRVVNSVKRQVRILATRQIGNRAMNSSAASIAQHETMFMRPMIDMSKGYLLGGVQMPGDVKAPKDGDVSITWNSRTNVTIGLLVRPYNCPKAIQAFVGLDLSTEV